MDMSRSSNMTPSCLQNFTKQDNASFVQYTYATFGFVDYLVFAIFLCVSGGVGVFYSFRNKKTTDDVLFGGRQMKAVPVGISTGVSFLSGASIVGYPSEMYINGYSYLLATFSGSFGYLVSCMLVAYILRPLNVTSLSEFFKIRFKSRLVNFAANFMVVVCIFQYMGYCMFGSVVAFKSVTGGQVGLVIALVIGGSVGIFYTAIGGLKAVVWSDVMQSGIMIIGVLVVVFKSIIDTPGGISEIIHLNKEYGRFHSISISTDFTIRHTLWGLLIGMTINWSSYAIQPAGVLRMCCTKTVKDAYIVSVVAATLFFIFTALPCWAGMNIFGYYTSIGCDVYAAGWVKNNELILYYVRDRLSYPGFQGLFIATLYAGSLSSLSSGLSAASAILWQDTIRPHLKVELSESSSVLATQVIVVVFGVSSMCWCYVLISFGGLLNQVNSTITSSMFCSYFGLYLLSLFFENANSVAAVIGLFVSFGFTLWLGIGNLLHVSTTPVALRSNTENCEYLNTSIASQSNSSVIGSTIESQSKSAMEYLFSISYTWLSAICLFVYFLVALCMTGVLGKRPHEFDRRVVFPLIRRKIPHMEANRSHVSSKSSNAEKWETDYELEKLHISKEDSDSVESSTHSLDP